MDYFLNEDTLFDDDFGEEGFYIFYRLFGVPKTQAFLTYVW